MQINREDVVQAALMVERYCKEHRIFDGDCECPFQGTHEDGGCFLNDRFEPAHWGLNHFLRARGLKDDD